MFVGELQEEETMVVILHEILHCNFFHHLRKGKRDHYVWNMACDYVINLVLDRCHYRLPTGCLLDEQFAAKTAEEVYEILAKEISKRPDPKPQAGNGKGNGSGQGSGQGDPDAGDDGDPEGSSGSEGEEEDGEGDPAMSPLASKLTEEEREQAMRGEVSMAKGEGGEELTEAEINAAEKEMKKIISIADRVSCNCGKGSNSLYRELVDSALVTEANWGRLQDYVSKLSKDESSWSSPNRRHIHAGMYLPSMKGTKCLGDIVLVCDSSGSISNDVWASYMSSFRTLFEQYKIDQVTVLVCDDRIQAEHVDILPEEIEDVKNVGCGGTNFRPPFLWVEEHGIQVDLMIYLTDLCCSDYPCVPPAYPVVWACWGSYDKRMVPPFGEVIKV
jgi:predicted metal-dependent peptidase